MQKNNVSAEQMYLNGCNSAKVNAQLRRELKERGICASRRNMNREYAKWNKK